MAYRKWLESFHQEYRSSSSFFARSLGHAIPRALHSLRSKTNRRALKGIKSGLMRLIFQTRDKNFIGFDKYRKRGPYHWMALADKEDYRRKLKVIEAVVEPEHHCLDLGCGDGAYVYALSKRCRSVTGIDADYDAVQIANSKLADHKATNCKCIQAPLSKVTPSMVPSKSQYDLVYSMDMLEHLPDPHELMRVAVSVVKPQGVVIIGTPLFISSELVSPYHVREFTKKEMWDLVSRYLRIKEMRVLPGRRKNGRVYNEEYCILIGTING